MAQTLTDRTRIAPGYGAETIRTQIATETSGPILAGLLAWLPALVILIGMPVLALVTTKYALVPSVKRAFAQEAAAGRGTDPMILAKIPLSLSGAKNVHAGFRSLGLVGSDSAFKSKIEQNKAKLTQVAAADLQGKTVSDLDKPGVLEALRTQLLTDLNHSLGGPAVKEVYIAVYPQP